jgi:hypothetical protein
MLARRSAGGGAELVHAAPRRIDDARQERRGSWTAGIFSRRLVGCAAARLRWIDIGKGRAEPKNGSEKTEIFSIRNECDGLFCVGWEDF